LNCGDTFLTSDEDDELFHLWIVVTPPSPEGVVITVCVCTRLRKHEPLVILRPGDHPFIQHESVIAYNFSKVRRVEDIERAIKSKMAKPREPASPNLLKRAQDGLLDSERTPNGVKWAFKEAFPD